MVVLIWLIIFLYEWRVYSTVLDQSCVRSDHFEILAPTEKEYCKLKRSSGKYEHFVVKYSKTIVIAVVFEKWLKQ